MPALLEEVKIPLEFRRIQAADLSDWSERPSNPGFDALVTAIAAILGAGVSTTIESSGKPLLPGSPLVPSTPSQSQQGWHGELIATGWSLRKMRVHLSHDTHLVEFSLTKPMGIQIVKVDDIFVVQAGGPVAWPGTYEFQIADGDQRYPATIESEQPIWPYKIRPCRLTVAGRLVYSE